MTIEITVESITMLLEAFIWYCVFMGLFFVIILGCVWLWDRFHE